MRERSSSFAPCSAASRCWISASISLKPSIRTPISSCCDFVTRSEKVFCAETVFIVRSSSRMGSEMTRCIRDDSSSATRADPSIRIPTMAV